MTDQLVFCLPRDHINQPMLLKRIDYGSRCAGYHQQEARVVGESERGKATCDHSGKWSQSKVQLMSRSPCRASADTRRHRRSREASRVSNYQLVIWAPWAGRLHCWHMTSSTHYGSILVCVGGRGGGASYVPLCMYYTRSEPGSRVWSLYTVTMLTQAAGMLAPTTVVTTFSVSTLAV